MLHTDSSNTIFKLAADFVNNTSRHIFLTGKAGTGKTTFLRYIKENTQKHAVVVAPTGVAAINAGGVTMHSFFQLPFGPYLPGGNKGFTDNSGVADRHSLFKNIRFNADKRELLEELELLIIDEISMVRADMLDAMDAILRYFRRKPHLPFGGVQVLYIGDMYQLPPVVNNNEWDILQPYYDSPFFFSAQVIEQAAPLYIELKKIYRQNEQQFIDVLNRVRNNQVTQDDFTLLNKLYQPGFTAPATDKYITLSTHNRSADIINATELEKLPGQMVVFNGTITGDFSDKAFPTDKSLQLKEGAQVMFIKNDSGTDRKFFNGKLATIKKINTDKIVVTSNSNNEEIQVEKETWRNLRYSYDKETDRIKEEELGSFTQYPIRLAWAITVHKSQGLTFDRAVIDAGASFAAGQVYVALSRCTSLQGMVLLSRLHPSAIATDQRVIAFAQKEAAAEELQKILDTEQQDFWASSLLNRFDWKKAVAAMEQFRDLVQGKKLPDPNAAIKISQELFIKSQDHALVANKFQQQLTQILKQVAITGDKSILDERVNKAIAFFIKAIALDLLQPLQKHTNALQHATKLRKYVNELIVIQGLLQQQIQKLIKTSYGDIVFCKDPGVYDMYSSQTANKDVEPDVKSKKPAKGSSQQESLDMFKEGKTVKDIATVRQLAESTVVGHLSMFVRTGELSVFELLSAEKVMLILPVISETGGNAVSPIKEILGDDFSYADIRIVVNHWQWLQLQKVNA